MNESTELDNLYFGPFLIAMILNLLLLESANIEIISEVYLSHAFG